MQVDRIDRLDHQASLIKTSFQDIRLTASQRPSPCLPWELLFRILDFSIPSDTPFDLNAVAGSINGLMTCHTMWLETKRILGGRERYSMRLYVEYGSPTNICCPKWLLPHIERLVLHVHFPDFSSYSYINQLEGILSQLRRNCLNLAAIDVVLCFGLEGHRTSTVIHVERQRFLLYHLVHSVATLLPVSVKQRRVALVTEEVADVGYCASTYRRVEDVGEVAVLIWLKRGLHCFVEIAEPENGWQDLA